MNKLAYLTTLLVSGLTIAQQQFVDETARTRSRAVYFKQADGKTIAPQIAIDCASAKWKDAYMDQAEKMDDGDRWRLGRNFWSSLDSGVPFTMSGVDVAAGHYYLSLAKAEESWDLLLFDANKVRAKQIDAYLVAEAGEGIAVPLIEVDSDDDAKVLSMQIQSKDKTDSSRLTFRLDFGPFHFTAPMSVPAGEGAQAFAGPALPRRGSRFGLFDPQGPTVKNVAVEHSVPLWNANRSAQLDQIKPGGRWRLGSDFWATLDNHVDIDIGGVTIPVGQHYLALERQEGDAWHLVVLDAAEMREIKADAFMANDATIISGGIEAPLKTENSKTTVKKLTVGFEQQKNGSSFVVAWGPHRMTAPVKLHIEK